MNRWSYQLKKLHHMNVLKGDQNRPQLNNGLFAESKLIFFQMQFMAATWTRCDLYAFSI